MSLMCVVDHQNLAVGYTQNSSNLYLSSLWITQGLTTSQGFLIVPKTPLKSPKYTVRSFPGVKLKGIFIASCRRHLSCAHQLHWSVHV